MSLLVRLCRGAQASGQAAAAAPFASLRTPKAVIARIRARCPRPHGPVLRRAHRPITGGGTRVRETSSEGFGASRSRGPLPPIAAMLPAGRRPQSRGMGRPRTSIHDEVGCALTSSLRDAELAQAVRASGRSGSARLESSPSRTMFSCGNAQSAVGRYRTRGFPAPAPHAARRGLSRCPRRSNCRGWRVAPGGTPHDLRHDHGSCASQRARLTPLRVDPLGCTVSRKRWILPTRPRSWYLKWTGRR